MQHASPYTDAVIAAIERAQRKATKTGNSYAVIEIDGLDDRVIRVVPEWYCDDPEFVAFCGEIIEIVAPETTSERILRLWRSFSRRHTAAFHAVNDPQRLAKLAEASALLRRIRPLMVAHGLMHRDTLTY